MDEDREVELSDTNGILQNRCSSGDFLNSVSVDSLLDDFLRNTRTCTHTHTCNPPGPDAAHTHTCYHTHTQVLTSEEDDQSKNEEKPSSKQKRPLGNREAVRKYREKKKAHTAYLEEEVKQLHLVNQQLVKKLQGQAILEAEVLRLRSLLADLRGKIDNELGISVPPNTILNDGDCAVQSTGEATGLRCQTDLPCLHPYAEGSSSQASIGINGTELVAPWEGNCQPPVVDCQVNTIDMLSAEERTLETVEALISSSSQAE
ncbi:hypothetical protein HS088_TW08G00770 [Tripterygium wilfordii]|uniref:BZIP domain-containing protein n=1 Tax=Tripterygium wilfordii TaxID=458696 RepID=A0A7J7DD01_TRIWF|nr:basic leucine zipper 23-like [Tripterygium wilfordii]KAF5744174.1 hypothetical protein HS088_TW08G00770 [Tripterygium wilfordii]